MFKFQSEYTREDRIGQSREIKSKGQESVPIIVEKPVWSNLPSLMTWKLTVLRKVSVSEFISMLRGKLRLRPEDTIILFVQGKYLVSPTVTIGDLYDTYEDPDGFIYILYTE